MSKVFLITGTPGVGKTTLSGELEALGWKVWNILDLAKDMDALTGQFDTDRDAIVIDDDKVHNEFSGWFEDQEEDRIIVEGHIGDLIPRDILTHCFVLSPSIDILRPRLEDRGYTTEKIRENIEAHIMKECLYDALEYYGESRVTDITNENFPEIFEKVKSIIDNHV